MRTPPRIVVPPELMELHLKLTQDGRSPMGETQIVGRRVSIQITPAGHEWLEEYGRYHAMCREVCAGHEGHSLIAKEIRRLLRC